MTAEIIPDAAASLAGWHDSSLRALQLRCERDATFWHCADPGPQVYFSGITLGDPAAQDDHMRAIETLARERRGDDFAVCDSFAALDLSQAGFEVMRRGTWMVRRPAEPERRPFPPDLVIERVVTERQLHAWEEASAFGFQMTATPAPGSLHAAGILTDGRMQVFAGKVDGRVVAGSMGYLSDRVNGVYAVSTIPEFRRRGYAEWLTWRALLGRPHQPATLQPSEQAEPLYLRMGFETVGEYVVWRHRP